MSCSAFAGNPLFISLEELYKDGLLPKSYLAESCSDKSEHSVDYEMVISCTQKGLVTAWKIFQSRKSQDTLEKFAHAHPWVRNYSQFMALKDYFQHKAWMQWPEELRKRTPGALDKVAKQIKDTINYYIFEQLLFFRQWNRMHQYARNKNIRIIGDIPLYVAHDSADTWAKQAIFALSADTGNPVEVAGVPPDYFSKTGQRWGNPLYRWNDPDQSVRTELFKWWKDRFEATLSVVDILRVDHFRGFESYWAIPAGEETAVNGKWKQGAGKEFFQRMEKKLGRLPIIAEDLGTITPMVAKLRNDLGYPGMKVLLFAFDDTPENPYLPQNVPVNSIVYTGTHDNATAVGWFFDPDVKIESKRRAKLYANTDNFDAATFHQDIIYLAQSSVSCLSIIPLQDILGFGNDCRMNTPGTSKGNWQWRCAAKFLTDEVAEKLFFSTHLFNRTPSCKKENKKT